ncbi:hypothetical protein [Azotosporobacter soli]|uniref:hypothetical protein n=1 Tax=Azotosporobacter soli TaxID=3055040 RepID=UPI0031FE9BA2
MKRFLLFVFLFTLLVSSVSLASPQTTYTVDDSFTIDIPASHLITATKKSIITQDNPFFLAATFTSITRQNIDNELSHMLMVIEHSKIPHQIESSGSLTLNNRDAAFILSSTNNCMMYEILYIIYGDNIQCRVLAFGKYEDLDKDRREIESIVSTIKMLK